VGLGVVDRFGRLPSDTWGVVVGTIASSGLQDVALGLLRGNSVVSSDDEVQVSWIARQGVRGMLRIRDSDPTTLFGLDIWLEALGQAEIDKLESPDAAGVANVPDGWIVVQSETTQIWELFNCRIDDVRIGRSN